MSPVSRGRKGKKQQRGPATGRSRGDRSNAGLDGFEGLYAEMLRAFRPLVKVIDPLEVEVFASDLVGAWWRQLPPGEDAEMVFGLGAIDHAARAGTREALALLRALAAVGVTAEQREAASTAAAALAAGGRAEPPWAGQIGRVRVGECWRLADVYGDQASLLVMFGYGRRRHGLVALVDFNHLGGWVKDLFVTAEPARTLRELRKATLSEPLTRLEQVDPAAARGLLEDGLAATDATWQPEVSQELRQYRALALARCRAMPEPARSGEPDREIGEAEPEAIVAEFLASSQAGDLPDSDAARRCARLSPRGCGGLASAPACPPRQSPSSARSRATAARTSRSCTTRRRTPRLCGCSCRAWTPAAAWTACRMRSTAGCSPCRSSAPGSATRTSWNWTLGTVTSGAC